MTTQSESTHAVRPATPEDIPAILRLIKDLAEYEKEPEAVEATEELLHQALFSDSPAVFAHVVEQTEDLKTEGAKQEIAGFALWFITFSTWLGKPGIYLEDLFIRPESRGLGYGKALLQTLADICISRGYRRFEWSVLDWNEPAIGFYKNLGAMPMDEWTVFRLTGTALEELGTLSQFKRHL